MLKKTRPPIRPSRGKLRLQKVELRRSFSEFRTQEDDAIAVFDFERRQLTQRKRIILRKGGEAVGTKRNRDCQLFHRFADLSSVV